MSQDEYRALQRAIQDQGHTWAAGPTPLSALPPEQQERRLGLRLIPDEMARLASVFAEAVPVYAEFPPAWDWRDVDGADWTTSIRDQKACGSCVAFGTVAVLEAMLKRHHQDASLQPDLSEAHLFFCGCGDCCEKGWWPSYALDYAKNNGVPNETCFPYQDHDMPCSDSCADWQSQAFKVENWKEVVDVGARKEWLSAKGPMVGCMAVFRDFFAYTGGVYRPTTNDLAGYHAICVVGYSDTEECWICKNSWGPSWGDGGWFKMGYGECQMDTQFAMYGVEAITPPSPEPPPPPPPPPPPDGCNLVKRILEALRGS
jgi:C1A family cysteine protease